MVSLGITICHLPNRAKRVVAIELMAVERGEDWEDFGLTCAVLGTKRIFCPTYERYWTLLKLNVRMEDIF
jgi:hypothetical protein